MPLIPDALARLRATLPAMRGFAPLRPAPESKASRAGPLIAFESLGGPVWSPRDYAAFSREGFMSNAIVYRCVRMICEAAASVPLCTCDANLGDARCTIGLASSTYRGNGSILAVASPRSFSASGLSAYASDWFTRGLLTFTSGAALGQAIEIKSHAVAASGTVSLELWAPARLPLAPGQTFTLTAGCDKTLATCRDKFANAPNHRGFPTIPGNDFLISSPVK